MLVERKPRRKPLTTATEPNSNSVVGIEGLRFNILSGNHVLIGEVAPDIFYGNTGNQGSTVPTLGTKLQSRDKLPFNPQIKGGDIWATANGRIKRFEGWHRSNFKKFTRRGCSTLPIDQAVEGLIKGLCQEVRHDSTLMDEMSSIHESDDKTLAYATSA
ncbi:hypothetical protein J1N35_043312 [Gossypium stocksii]|uniref:Uncharacterized protein n=1 Tax=Gossypium stocksii TaxID=47602 RepID=A0A9D3U774_9ROSI|nr:hypothetical protein J1N35_043312 [Gossypium stocksii]